MIFGQDIKCIPANRNSNKGNNIKKKTIELIRVHIQLIAMSL